MTSGTKQPSAAVAINAKKFPNQKFSAGLLENTVGWELLHNL